MCQYHSNLQSIRCIIPPYINQKLMLNDDADIAALAINNELQASMLRTSRRFISGLEKTRKSAFRSLIGVTTSPGMKMQIYDIKHSSDFENATLLWENGTEITRLDKDARNIVLAGSATWDFYQQLFGRNSVDNLGMLLKHYIHYGNTFDDMNNAFWDGMQMCYGDGDGRIFGSFTSDPDIIGHELTHGVTEYESNLRYHNQSGALNESLSDIFGIMIKQKMQNIDVQTSNWLIGENVLIGNKYALRSMKEPGKAYVNHPELGNDPQPATMDDYQNLPDTPLGDFGGVHYNSGIPNFAFYVAAFDIGGFAWEKAGQIWYEAMTDSQLKQNSNFIDFKNLTIQKAEAKFGINSKEAKAVKNGWKTAKV